MWVVLEQQYCPFFICSGHVKNQKWLKIVSPMLNFLCVWGERKAHLWTSARCKSDGLWFVSQDRCYTNFVTFLSLSFLFFMKGCGLDVALFVFSGTNVASCFQVLCSAEMMRYEMCIYENCAWYFFISASVWIRIVFVSPVHITAWSRRFLTRRSLATSWLPVD